MTKYLMWKHAIGYGGGGTLSAVSGVHADFNYKLGGGGGG